ncbi:hypothetical protein [Flavobacterium piscis]|uniref:DUF4843 domain-containing protein n=1 Tax=Flavobacterium piscis TaxID=1114874 RepID=A0ABU1Y724_9FLAO|nr:hypothetical protein [Flavobacterium piscis]MDR7210037.1 hypothetical protein [Flavobacterium piscis]
MKLSGISKITKFLGLIFLGFSCSGDLDFDQVNDLQLKPVLVANLIYFDIPASAFIDDETEQSVVFDAQDFDPFRNSLLREDLMKTEFSFEITNTISRAYKIDLILIDAQNNPIETLSFTIPAYTGTNNVLKFTEIFENQRLVNLKKTIRVGFVITMAPGMPLNENSTGNLKLRSGATLYFEIED